jgi:molybdopterin/thiamine biosynthesis adenylyltransferase
VPVKEHTGELTAEVISTFGIVVVTGISLSEATRINEICRKSGGHFIMCSTHGLFGSLFCDFGDNFTVVDPNGEHPSQ